MGNLNLTMCCLSALKKISITDNIRSEMIQLDVANTVMNLLSVDLNNLLLQSGGLKIFVDITSNRILLLFRKILKCY